MSIISKSALTTIAISLFVLAQATPVYAGTLRGAREELREAKREVKEERRDFFKELKDKISSRAGFFKRIWRPKHVIGRGELTAINGTTLTVEKDSKSYTVL